MTVNGVRFVLNDDSWGLVRASSNKPSIVIVAESRTSRDQLYAIMEQDRRDWLEQAKSENTTSGWNPDDETIAAVQDRKRGVFLCVK